MSLRDALLNAGKIDKKQKKKADKSLNTAEHQGRKRRKKKKKAPADAVTSAVKTAEQSAAEAAQRRRAKLAEIVSEGRIEDSGRRRFHYIARNDEIYYMTVSDVVGFQLEGGKAAIVEDYSEKIGDHAIVSQDAALKVINVDRDSVRFYNAS